MNLKEFFQECKEKDVFKNLSIYIVSSWVFLQVFALISEPLGFPKISLTYLLLILIVGFPIYVYLIWRYRIKEEHIEESDAATEALGNNIASAKSGIEIDPDNEALSLSAGIDRKFRKMYFLGLSIIVLFSAASALIIVRNNLLKNDTPFLNSLMSGKSTDKIAILKFDNNTGNEELDMVGKIAVDWIMHGITQNKAGEVISPKLIEDYSNVLKASIIPSGENGILTEYLKPSKVIIGDYYLNRGQLLIQASMTDANIDQTLMTFAPVECDPDSPLDCIEALKQRVLGYLIADQNKKNNLQERPPRYEAYKSLLLAKDKGNAGESEEYIRLLNQAISQDSSYFEPKVLRVAYYYNQGQYVKSDSLLQALSSEDSNFGRQVNLLNLYEALLEGNNRNTFAYLKNEYDESPTDMETNYSLMTLAQQFINNPEKVDSIYTVINNEHFDLEKCLYCEYRYYIKGLADIELGRYDEVIEMLTPFAKTKGQNWLKRVLVRAHLLAGNDEAVAKILSEFKIFAERADWVDLTLKTAKDYLLLKNEEKAQELISDMLKEAKLMDSSNENKLVYKAQGLFFAKDYINAEMALSELISINSDNLAYNALLAITYHKNNKMDHALATLARIEGLRASYQYGSVDYTLAQYYGATGQEQETLEHLLKAVADGRRYLPGYFQYDPLLTNFHEHPVFQDVLDYWK